jgi:hypothetical protein
MSILLKQLAPISFSRSIKLSKELVLKVSLFKLFKFKVIGKVCTLMTSIFETSFSQDRVIKNKTFPTEINSPIPKLKNISA